MSEFKDPAYQDWLAHSAKGTAWKNHKYIEKKQQEDGDGWTYVYGKGAYSKEELTNKIDQWVAEQILKGERAEGASDDEINDAIDSTLSEIKNNPEYEQGLAVINSYYNSEDYQANKSKYGGDPLRNDVTSTQNRAWNNDIGDYKKKKEKEHKDKLKSNGVSLVSKSSSSRIKGATDPLPFEHSDNIGKFKDPVYQDWLKHSAKGSAWKNHKYSSKKTINGKLRYVYGGEDSSSGSTFSIDDYNNSTRGEETSPVGKALSDASDFVFGLADDILVDKSDTEKGINEITRAGKRFITGERQTKMDTFFSDLSDVLNGRRKSRLHTFLDSLFPDTSIKKSDVKTSSTLISKN